MFADQTPRGGVRKWPEVREFKLWHLGTVNDILGNSESEEESTDSQLVIVFHNQELIDTVSSDSDSTGSDLDSVER